MKVITFTKMHGCGNDFIMIDNSNHFLQGFDLAKFARDCCNRKFHVGADGLVLIEQSKLADFSMRYFNADGSEGEMCGNGARCVAKYAYQKGIAKNDRQCETKAGLHRATILNDEKVRIYFPHISMNNIQLNKKLHLQNEEIDYHFLQVGVPHTVIFREEHLFKNSFEKWAKEIRDHEDFSQKGTNVNVVTRKKTDRLYVRTYERGVEAETLACGSGATAAAIVYALQFDVRPPIVVEMKGGELEIDFVIHTNEITSITLTGQAQMSFIGSFVYESS